jgi:flagellar biogenesis protein FliO
MPLLPGPLVVLSAAAHHAGGGAARTGVTGTAAHAAAHAVTTAPTVSAGHMLVQLVVALAVVVGLVLLAKRFARGRAGGALGVGGGRRNPVKVVGRQSLGKGVSVAVVEFGDQAYLVGVTPNTVRRLATTDAHRVAEAAGAREPARRVAAEEAGAPTLLRAFHQVAPGLAARLAPVATRTVPLPAGGATVLDLVPVPGTPRPDRAGDGTARTFPTGSGDGTARARTASGARPAPTWTSAIEHLRERTVRRA